MNLTSAAYSLALTIALVALTITAFVSAWPIAYIMALPATLCSALITGELMMRHSRYNRG